MPRYFFDIKNGHRLIDPAGLECAGDDDAIAKAKLIASQIAQEAAPNGQRQVAVLDSNRREVSRVPVHLSSQSAAE